MIEKLLENWLTSTNERGFMIPFCQLLVSKGYTLLYISPHGLLEEGKDIIALNKSGRIEAFQLKNGNITLGVWRSIYGEMNELVNIPIQHPSVSEKIDFLPWLVTNGEVKDPVRTQIVTLNRDNWGNIKSKKLKYQDKGVLLADFLKYYGHFFPSEPLDFKLFLELHLSDGTDMLKKDKYIQFIESHLKVRSLDLTPTEAKSLISSSIIMSSYVLTPWINKKNYVAQIEVWTCLISTIFAIVTKFNLDKKYYGESLKIIQVAIDDCFNNLLDEVKNRQHLIEGDWKTDSFMYRSRVSIILGYLCSYVIYKRLQGIPLNENTEAIILDICKKYKSYLHFDGESFSPLMITYFWFDQLKADLCQSLQLIQIIILALIDDKHYPTAFGWPNPYYDYEQSLRINTGFLDKEHTDSFTGKSYTLKSFLGLVIRRNKKDFLGNIWKMLSHTQYAEFICEEKWETFVWRADDGTEESRFPNQTQSWKLLRDESFSKGKSEMPDLLKTHADILTLFILVFPHRMTDENVRYLDLLLFPNLKNLDIPFVKPIPKPSKFIANKADKKKNNYEINQIID